VKTQNQETIPGFDPSLFKRGLQKIGTQINLLKSDAALLQGEEKKIINNKISEKENKKGYLIISLRKTILDCPKGLKNFLLHTHPIPYRLITHPPFEFSGPNFCNYVTEAVVLSYIHGKCAIAFGKEENDQVYLPLLKKFLQNTLKIELTIEPTLVPNRNFLEVNNLIFKAS
jgi:hypothetical protein